MNTETDSQIKLVLNAKSLVKLIEALKLANASHFKYGPLEISFIQEMVKGTEIGNGVMDSQPLSHYGGDGPTPNQGFENNQIDEEKLMTMMISDPHQYEETMSQLEANENG